MPIIFDDGYNGKRYTWKNLGSDDFELESSEFFFRPHKGSVRVINGELYYAYYVITYFPFIHTVSWKLIDSTSNPKKKKAEIFNKTFGKVE